MVLFQRFQESLVFGCSVEVPQRSWFACCVKGVSWFLEDVATPGAFRGVQRGVKLPDKLRFDLIEHVVVLCCGGEICNYRQRKEDPGMWVVALHIFV